MYPNPTRPVYRGYLHPTQRYLATYGGYGEDIEAPELTAEEQAAMVRAATIGLAIAGVWTFGVGPWAVKQFKPRWGYGKRLVTSFLAGIMINIARKAISPAQG